MAQTVNVPGVGTLQFPDGMSQQDMAAAIQKNYPQIHGQQAQPSALEQAGQFGKEALQSGGRMLVNAATGVPGIFANAATAAGNILTGHVPLHNPDGSINWSGQADSGAMNLPSRQLEQNLEPLLGKSPSLFSPAGVAEAIGSGVASPNLPGGSAASRASNAVSAPVTRPQQLAVLEGEGVRMDNAQFLNSKAAITAKNAANDGAFGDAAAFREAQKGDFTAAALRKMGVTDAREATPAVMQAGRQALKDTYNEIAARNGVEYDTPLNQTISQIRYAAGRALTPENAQVIHNQIDDLQKMVDNNAGRLSGDGYQQYQSALDKVAKDGGKAPFVTELRQAVTDAMQRQAQQGDAALLARTNQRYAAMKAIQKAIGDDNQVSPAGLFNALDTVKGANATVFGQGSNQPLVQLAQAGKAILSKETANSGTPQRLAGMAALTTAGGALTALATGHFETAGSLAATAAAAGFSQQAAKALAYTPAGRQWLQRWAQAQVTAGQAGQGAVALGKAGALGAAETANNSDQ